MGTSLSAMPPHLRSAVQAQLGPSCARAQNGPRGMNATERRHADLLEARKLAGDVLWWAYEPLSFALGGGAKYRPDFIWIDMDGGVHATEVKGGLIREAAMVRFKVASERYPWVNWWMIRWGPGSWDIVRDVPASIVPLTAAERSGR